MVDMAYLTMLRPTQWLKNLMLFFPPFLAGHALQPGMLAAGVVPFAAFCLISSAGYLLNDLLDRERDRLHPLKRLRPVAAGEVTPAVATGTALLLALAGCVMAIFVSQPFFVWLVLYAGLSFFYSCYGKHLPLVDICCIAAGFLIRLQAGGIVYNVAVTVWLFLLVFLLAVFLSTGKRLAELCCMPDEAVAHRGSLSGYSRRFLVGMLYLSGSTVLLVYLFYTLHKPKLIITVPLCLIGLVRYICRVRGGRGGDPTESLLKDPVLGGISAVWALIVIWSIYR